MKNGFRSFLSLSKGRYKMSQFKAGKKNIVAETLRMAANYGKGDGGTFWVPPGASPDLGYILPNKVNPALNKGYQSDRNPKDKNDDRCRNLH